MLTSYNELFFHCGNILHIDEITRRTGITSREELADCLRVALRDGKRIPDEKLIEIYNFTIGGEVSDVTQLYTVVKLFLYIPSAEIATKAVDWIKSVLHNLTIDALIIWYPKEMKKEPTAELLEIWNALSEYVTQKKIIRMGLADLETPVFINLYNRVKVKPEILHLNERLCCCVPPDLQKFAAEREIQLLTHYDPPDIMPPENLTGELKNFKPVWIARYQSHIKCHSVLTKRGYMAYFRQV